MHGGFRTSTIRIEKPEVGFASTPSSAISDYSAEDAVRSLHPCLAAELEKVPSELRGQEALNLLAELARIVREGKDVTAALTTEIALLRNDNELREAGVL